MKAPQLTTRARTRLSAAVCAAMVLGVLGEIGGCGTARTAGDPLAGLRRLASREPLGEATDAPSAPPGLDRRLFERTESERAGKSIEEIAAELSVDPPEPVSVAPAEPAERTRATKLYAAGRSAMLDGTPERAVELLSAATELDPSAGRVWRALGEAQIAAGSGARASRSLERAVALGEGDAAVWELLGREAIRAGDWDLAIPRLFQARAALEESDDQLLGSLIDIQLAEALQRRGYERGALEALRRALDLPRTTRRSTRYAAEISALYRRRGDYWIEIGDLACRQGAYRRAAEAFERGASLPRLSLEPVLPRIVFAWVGAGAPNKAALAIVESIDLETAGAAEQLIGLIKYVTEQGAARAEVSEAIASLAEAGAPGRPSTRSALARLRAAALPPAGAVEALSEGLEHAPGDARLAYEIYLRAEDDQQAAALASRQVRAHPYWADMHASALLQTGRRARAIIAQLGSSRADRLLAARLLLASGDRSGALEIARSVGAAGSGVDALMHAGEIAAESGDWDLVAETLARLEQSRSGGASGALARGRVLAEAQRFELAAREVEPLLVSEDREIALLLFAGDLLTLLDRTGEAEQLLLEARALDPGDERTHARLIELYLSTRSTKLAEAARELRVHLPESPLLRRLRARELAQFGQGEAALEELTSLIDVRPPDRRTFALVSVVLEQESRGSSPAASSAAMERIAGRLTELTQSLPDVPFVRASAVRALSAVGRHESAVELARFSQDEEVARAAEFVVRYGLGDQERAVQMSLDRLRRSARSIAEALELATLLSREGDVVGAAELVREGIPTSSELAGPQREAVGSIVARGAARAFETRDGADVLAALSLIEWANENQPPLGYAMHEARIALISRSPNEERVERMLRAVEEAGGQHPEQRARAVRVAIDALRLDGSDEPLRLARELALRTEPDAEAEVDPLVDALFLWGREVCLGGGAVELREFVENTGERFRLAGVTEALLREAGEPSRAQLAYAVAVNAASLGRMDAAMGMYRVVLELDPDHGMALNDLGYFLITEQGNIEEAEPMLERAYRLRSDSSNVVDSLGWLRYKQGKLADFDENGERKLGAVTLLTRAKALQPNPRRQNPNILEHLGDALWASGDYEAADQEWSAAMRAARIRRRELEGAQAEVDRLSEQVARLARKIAASNRGERPEIEPRIGEQDSVDSDGISESADDAGGSQPESPDSNTSTDR